MSFLSCEKEEGLRPTKISSNLSQEINDIYNQMTPRNFGNINIVGDNILKFENEQHYESTLNLLMQQKEEWVERFLNRFAGVNEDSLDVIIDHLNFDENQPLIMFENNYGIFESNLRYINSVKENTWLLRGAEGEYPFDRIVPDEVEQTLLSNYYEVCIGNIIYQLRDSMIVLIPLSSIEAISNIRAAHSYSELEGLISSTHIGIMKYVDACYEYSFFSSGEQMHPEVGDKKFYWSFSYRKSLFGHKYVTKTIMKNFKKKNSKWIRDYVNCSLAQTSSLWSCMLEDQACSKTNDSFCLPGNAFKAHSKLRIVYTNPVLTIEGSPVIIGPFTYNLQNEIEEFHIDPYQSNIQCRHQGWTYRFNAGTTELE